MKTGLQFAECALLPKWDKFTYEQMDCQAFVEAVLKDIGVRKADGSVYDWRGSNSMWRNYYSWRGTIEECKKKYGLIPVGAFVYIRDPSGEEKVGYTDGLGNFRHVGIYVGSEKVRDSTYIKNKRDGVGTRSIKGFTHVSLFSGLDYLPKENYTSVDEVLSILERMNTELTRMEEDFKRLREVMGK